MPDPWMPLSAAQHGTWTAQQLDPTSPALNIAEYIEISGPVDVALLVAAIRRVVGETDAVGVLFAEDDDGPSQHLGQAPAWTVPVTDLTGSADPLARALAWMAAELARPVDLTAGPLFGHAVFVLAPDRVLWYHQVHHIALDGYGLGLFARRVAEVYTASVEGREPPECWFGTLRSVVDEDLAYQDSERFRLDRDHWADYSAGRPAPVTLAGRSRPPSETVVRAQADLDRPIVAALASAAQGVKAVWTEALTAAFAAYLHRMTGAGQVNLALPVMSRMGSVALRVPCMVLNVVPLWVEVGPEQSLAELTRRIASEVRTGRPHHRYRYEQLRRDLKLVASDRKLFGPSVNIMPFDYGLSFAGSPAVASNVAAGLVEDMVLNTYDRADGGGPHINLDANPACYTQEELDAHLRRFLAFLADLAAHPTRPIGEAALLLDEERRQLRGWNATAAPLPSATVPYLFGFQARRTPELTALVARDAALSFAELAEATNRLARFLIAHGAGPGRTVALVLPRTADAIIALLAVLAAGAAYVPIDPDYPPARVAFLIEDADPVLTLTTRALAGEHPDAVVLDDPDTAASVAALPAHELTDADRIAPLTPNTALALIYTSGSTGTPKGVVLEHAGMVNLFQHHRRHLIQPEVAAADGRRFRAALTASLSFDTSWEGLLWLLAGHELHFVGDDIRREPERLLRYIDAKHIDFLDITPTYAEELVTAGLLTEGRHCPAVIALGGEAAGARLWTTLREAPGLSAYNLYGPTECTVDTVWCRLADSETPVIGRPLTNTSAHVLDAHGRPLPPGAVGELYLAGVPLARGYHNRPELTAARFPTDPSGPPDSRMYRTGDLARWRADGNLEYLGRADEQVKIRGFRIEPGEIESVLSAHADVAQVAVLAREDRPGMVGLVAYVVPVDGTRPEPAALRGHVAERLPDYLVPSVYVLLDHLPLTTNGKLDRAALPAPDPNLVTTGRRPRDHREQLLCALFAETLGVAEIGIDDDFFALGGHSLLAARLIARIRDAFGVGIGIRAVFEAATVAALAEALDDDGGGGDNGMEVLIALRRNGSRPPVFCVAPATGLSWSYAGLISSLGPDQPIYGLQSRGVTDQNEPLPSTVGEIATDYLRRIRSVQPHGPYHLLGWSFGGLVAHDVAVRLQADGEAVGLLALVDSFPIPLSWRTSRPVATKDEFLGQIFDQSFDDLSQVRLDTLYRVFANNARLGAEFAPGIFAGDATLFASMREHAEGWPGPSAWAPHVSGHLDVHQIDSTHNEMTQPGPLAEIGAVLADLLRATAAV